MICECLWFLGYSSQRKPNSGSNSRHRRNSSTRVRHTCCYHNSILNATTSAEGTSCPARDFTAGNKAADCVQPRSIRGRDYSVITCRYNSKPQRKTSISRNSNNLLRPSREGPLTLGTISPLLRLWTGLIWILILLQRCTHLQELVSYVSVHSFYVGLSLSLLPTSCLFTRLLFMHLTHLLDRRSCFGTLSYCFLLNIIWLIYWCSISSFMQILLNSGNKQLIMDCYLLLFIRHHIYF